MRHDRAGGFTLMEVLVALALSGVVVLLAHRVFTGIVDGSARLQAARVALDREINARRWLSEAFGSLEIGTPGMTASFMGRPNRVEFTTAQQTAAGWHERRRVALALAGDSLVAVLDGAGSIALSRDVSGVSFDYLLEPGADARWVREWISPVSAPIAVRVRIEHLAGSTDTLLVLVGSRG